MTWHRKWPLLAIAGAMLLAGCGEKPMPAGDSMADQLNAAKKMPQEEVPSKKSSMEKIEKDAAQKGD